jgi:hypothetical protein
MYHDQPPVFTIDLSLPPAERYVDLALVFKEELRSLTGLFDQLVEDFLPNVSVKFVKGLARVALRCLNRREENEEIRGISRATGVDMYLLVAFNVLLDLLMGCTSGAARIKVPETGETRMLHFRTLDWGMDELREIVVQLNYIRRPSTEILGSSITYAGFVGVLTGVRQGLSMSLNFRPNHDASTRLANFRFYSHHLLILLGLRPSISSHLRQLLVPSRFSEKPLSLARIAEALPNIPTTACYAIFSDGVETITLEKDHRTAITRSSTSFIVTTNHDVATPQAAKSETLEGSNPQLQRNVGIADVIEESTERRNCMLANWERKVRSARRTAQNEQKRQGPGADALPAPSDPNTRVTRSRRRDNPASSSSSLPNPQSSRFSTSSSSSALDTAQNRNPEDLDLDLQVAASEQEIIKWVLTWPITNECTHFAAVLDPARGHVAWVQRFIEAVDSPGEEPLRGEFASAQRKRKGREESGLEAQGEVRELDINENVE